MRTSIAALLALLCSGVPSQAQTLCEGFAPDWRLEGPDDALTLTWLGETTFSLRHSAHAEDGSPVTAMTLLADRDTALLITRAQSCRVRSANWPIAATLLTQRQQTPVVLTGCCLTEPAS